MIWQIKPVWRALFRHKIAVLILVAEVAIACGIVSNLFFIVTSRFTLLNTLSGVDENRVAYVHLAGDERAAGTGQALQTLKAMQGIPGIESAAITSIVPFGGVEMSDTISLKTDSPGTEASEYLVTGGGVRVLGLRLIQGRDFRDDEFVALGTSPSLDSTSIILTKPLAKRLFDDESAIGRRVYVSQRAMTVVGVVERLSATSPSFNERSEYSMIMPVNIMSNPQLVSPFFVMRCEPALCYTVLHDAKKVLRSMEPDLAVISSGRLSDAREEYFRRDRDMATLLLAACTALLLVTGLGIVGLASFWVQQRRKQIGMRRALGATRGDIFRYFLLENFLIVSGGIAIGVVCSYALNLLLIKYFEQSRLPFFYAPMSATFLWLLGQVAAFGPALKAARVSPMEATRESVR